MLLNYAQDMWQLAANGRLQGIWFWAAVYTFLICFYSVVKQIRIRTWSSVKGELKNLGIEKFGHDNTLSEQDYVPDALYRYSVDGKNYQGKRVSAWVITASHNARAILKMQLAGIQQFDGNQVMVFYNPSNPAKSFLILPSKFGIAVTFLISILPAITFWLRFYA